MSTTIFESGANVPSAFSVSTPSTPFEVRTASVLMRLTARCSCTLTVASPLNGVATKRTPPAGTAAVLVGTAGVADAGGGEVTFAPAPHADRRSETSQIHRTPAVTAVRAVR